MCINVGVQPPVGFEPTTCGLQNREHRTEGTQPQELTSGPTNACTNACTDGAEIEHGGPPEGDSELAKVVSAWPKLGPEPRQAIFEIVSRADRWWQFVAWAGQTATHLIAVGLQSAWNFRGKPRPSRTGSWYLSFDRNGQRLCIRLANHHRKLTNIVNVVWEREHEKALAEALRKLRAPAANAAASTSAAG